MIKKLRRKYMLITMSLVCILLYGMLALFYIRTSHGLKQESLDALKAYSDQNPAVLFDNRFGRFFGNQDKYAHYDIFVIEYREAGNILTPYGFGEITEEQKAYIFDLMNDVLSRKDDTGVTSNYNLRYMKTYQQGMIKVVFLDKSYEDSTLSSQLFTIITVAVTGTVLLFLITLALTRIAIRPVERSWLQQQQLVADVSHELKTPLAVISSNTDIVMSHSEQSVAEQKKWLGYIKSETERMSELISNILYLAKTDEIKTKIEKSVFDLSTAVVAASLPFESVCFEKGLKLVTNVEPDIAFYGNKETVMRLVYILIDNACKYSFKDTQVNVALYNTAEKTILAVNNKGNSISPDQAKHIFERFYRSDESRSNANNSFGLGLSIARSIVEVHGGRIDIESGENGNTFICTFKRLQ